MEGGRVTDEDQATGTTEQEEKSEVDKARKAAEEEEQAKEKVKALEEDPPAKLEDWPDDKAKYETFGGAEGQESYEESVTSKLGPSSLRYREDGGVEIGGEEVDDPEKYRSDPIPGGPTDPRMKGSRAYGEPDLTEETSADVEAEVSEDSGEDEESGGEDEQSGGEEEQSGGDEEGKDEGESGS
jgi:hypothetical protein